MITQPREFAEKVISHLKDFDLHLAIETFEGNKESIIVFEREKWEFILFSNGSIDDFRKQITIDCHTEKNTQEAFGFFNDRLGVRFECCTAQQLYYLGPLRIVGHEGTVLKLAF